MRFGLDGNPIESVSKLEKLHAETAKIPWSELQRFFAQGRVMLVSPELDLPSVAAAMADNDADQAQTWIEGNQITPVSDEQARDWFDQQAKLWAVVVSPFVLVQEDSELNNEDGA